MESELPSPSYVTPADSSIELYPQLEADAPSRTRRPSYPAYPRPDGGKDAWLFLWIGCVLSVAITWGLPFSYGVFQRYYASHPPFAGQSGVAAVGTTTLGILYLSSPLAFMSLQRYKQHRRTALIVGLATTVVALLASAFATKVWHLILTQGVLYGLGATVINTVTINFLDEWFMQRKGLAYGIQESAAGIGSVVITLLMTWGLDKYGHRTMLIAWAVAVAILSVPAIYYLRPRVSHVPGTAPDLGSFGFLTTPIFVLLQAGNVFQSLGNFLPGIYMPTFATNFNATSLGAAGILAVYNVFTMLGSIGTGYLVDKFHISFSLLLLSLGAASAVFFAWGFANSFGALYVFAALYGLFAGGWSSTWVGAALEVKKYSPRADLTIIWGFAAAARGVGSIASGPISEALLGTTSGKDAQSWPGSYGTSYGILILFTGAMLVLGGVGSVGKGVEIVRRIRQSKAACS